MSLVPLMGMGESHLLIGASSFQGAEFRSSEQGAEGELVLG